MASEEKQPPDKADRRYYKGHPKKLVSTVVCMVCGYAYYRRDFEKITKHNYEYIDDNQMICPDHVLDDITSPNGIDLSEVAKKVNAIIKLKKNRRSKERIATRNTK